MSENCFSETNQQQNHLIVKLLILITFIFCAYFFDGNLSNQNIKINSIFATVEKDPNLPFFAIDKYVNSSASNSVDWSYYNGHYYSNKAPGTLLFGSLVYWPIKGLEDMFGLDTSYGGIQLLNCYLINLLITILPISLAIGAFFLLLIQLNLTKRKATILSLFLIFCLPITAYSTSLWSHSTAAACLICALYYYQSATTNQNKLLIVGAALGMAVLFDYLAIIASLIIFLISCFKFKLQAKQIVVGAAPAIVIFFAYHYYCFDSVFATSITHTNSVFLDENKFLGTFSWPNLQNFKSLFFGHFRGIFTQFPLTIVSIAGIYYWLRDKGQLDILVICISLLASYYLTISAFNGWYGGATVATRYSISILFVWILCLQALPNKVILLTSPLALWSALNNLVIVSTSTLAPESHPSPLYEYAYKNFLNGNLSFLKKPILLQRFDPNFSSYQHLTSFNWGNLLGLTGHLSLLPLLMILFFLIYQVFNISKDD